MPSPRSKATPAPAEDLAASTLPNDPNEPLEDLHAAVLADQEARLSALEGDVASLLEGNRAVQSSLDILVRKLSGQETDEAAAGRGETIYVDNCAACHGDAGEGMAELRARLAQLARGDGDEEAPGHENSHGEAEAVVQLGTIER